ncbi:hypothetical protein HWV62_16656 [Athelia sp. TMB]|nr:hypothetical protein HWV62_16656 [Athelia sp. TMB]
MARTLTATAQCNQAQSRGNASNDSRTRRSKTVEQINENQLPQAQSQPQPQLKGKKKSKAKQALDIQDLNEGDLDPEEELSKKDEKIEELNAYIAKMQIELHQSATDISDLQERLMTSDKGPDGHDSDQLIPKPDGVAGWTYSIQDEMGLTGKMGDKNYDQYKAIQRYLHVLVFNARIDAELGWKQIPARDKATLFEVARDRIPFLARFEGDWATEDLVKQFLKNRRQNAYRKGYTEPPKRYAHLKENSLKRDPSGSRRKKAFTSAKRAGKEKLIVVRNGNRRTTKKIVVVESSEEEDSGDEDVKMQVVEEDDEE